MPAAKPYDRRADVTRPDSENTSWETPTGAVVMYAPTHAVPYYRIVWGSPQEGTTAGRYFDRAWAKALARELLIAAGATPRTERATSVGIAYWLSPERPKPRGSWGESHTKTMTYYAERYFTPAFGSIRLLDLRRSHIQQAVNLAPTESEGRNVRRAARSLIGALRQGDYLLENQVVDLATVWWHGVRMATVSEQGDDKADFVPRNKRPTHAQVTALREAMALRRRRGNKSWRALAVELAAYSGVRRGELAVLDDTTVHRDGRVRVLWRLETIGGPHLALPKGNKRRWTTYPQVTPTGFRLADAIARRLDEVAQEKAAGNNPRGGVATLAGHESAEFTIARYVSGGEDDISDSLAALGWGAAEDGGSEAGVASGEFHGAPDRVQCPRRTQVLRQTRGSDCRLSPSELRPRLWVGSPVRRTPREPCPRHGAPSHAAIGDHGTHTGAG